MLTSTTTNSANNSGNSNLLISSSSVSCWPALEPSLNRLLPPAVTSTLLPSEGPPLDSEDYLKLYTLVFEYCVGAGESRKGSGGRVAGLNVSGDELYRTLIKYLEIRFNQWSQSITVSVCICYFNPVVYM